MNALTVERDAPDLELDVDLAAPDPLGELSLDRIGFELDQRHRAVIAAAREGIANALRAGALLIEAKARIPHGGWLPWLERHGVGARSAQKYMRLFERRAELPAKVGVSEALKLIAKPKYEPRTHLENATEIQRAHDRLFGALTRLEHDLDAATTVDQCAVVVREADQCWRDAFELKARAQRGLGQLLAEIENK